MHDAVRDFVLAHLAEHGPSTLHGLWMRADEGETAGATAGDVLFVLDELRAEGIVERHIPSRLGAALTWSLVDQE